MVDYSCEECLKYGQTSRCTHCKKMLCSSCRESHKGDLQKSVIDSITGLQQMSTSLSAEWSAVNNNISAIISQCDIFCSTSKKNLRKALSLDNLESTGEHVSECRKKLQEIQKIIRQFPSDIPDMDLAGLNQLPSDIPVMDLAGLNQLPSDIPVMDLAGLNQLPSDIPVMDLAGLNQLPSDIPVMDLAGLSQLPSDIPVMDLAGLNQLPSDMDLAGLNQLPSDIPDMDLAGLSQLPSDIPVMDLAGLNQLPSDIPDMDLAGLSITTGETASAPVVSTAVMAQWLGCRTRNHKVASSSPVTAMGIGRLNHN